MRLLGVLDLRLVGARRVGEVLRAEQLTDLRPRGGDRRLRQRDRVGPHVGDEAVLVEPLRHRHRPRAPRSRACGRPPAAASSSGTARRACGCTASTRPSAPRRCVSCSASTSASARRAVELDHGAAVARARLQLAQGVEVRAARHPSPVDRLELGGEHPLAVLLAGVEGALEIPVRRGTERDPLTLAVDHEPGRDRLDPAGRQARHDLLPQHRRDLVAVEPVEDASRLLRLDEVEVQLPGVAPPRPGSPGWVISWKTIRRTGTFGFSSSCRCQAIASPSRSSSVAR